MTSVEAVAERPRGSRRVTPVRTSQIEDETWLPAMRIAKIRGDSLAAVMREAVERYERRHRHLLAEEDATTGNE